MCHMHRMLPGKNYDPAIHCFSNGLFTSDNNVPAVLLVEEKYLQQSLLHLDNSISRKKKNPNSS